MFVCLEAFNFTLKITKKKNYYWLSVRLPNLIIDILSACQNSLGALLLIVSPASCP